MGGRVEWVLTPLERAGVRYLVVGGVAVVLHGHLRTTLDLDLVVQLEPDNLERALTVFGDLGFHLFVQEPFDFDDVYHRALRVPLEQGQATVVAREDLIAMKRAAGRARDIEDVEALLGLSEDEP